MKLGSVTRTIDGNNYEVSYMPAMHNMSMFLRFSSLVGSALPKLFGTANSSGDFSLIGEAINSVLTSLYVNDPKGMIVLDILSNTKRNGAEINTITFDEFYTGNMSEMTKALAFSIEVHFKDFLPLDLLSGFLTKTEGTAAGSVANLTKS